MDYYNLEEWQVIREIRDHNPAVLNAKQIASKIGLTKETVYKWGEDPHYSGSSIPKKYIISFSIITNDKRLIEWYAFQIGYYLKPFEYADEINGDILNRFFNIGSSFGQLSKAIKNAHSDNKVDPADATKMLAITNPLIKEIRTLQEELKTIISAA